jgi:hypothetical protein
VALLHLLALVDRPDHRRKSNQLLGGVVTRPCLREHPERSRPDAGADKSQHTSSTSCGFTGPPP